MIVQALIRMCFYLWGGAALVTVIVLSVIYILQASTPALIGVMAIPFIYMIGHFVGELYFKTKSYQSVSINE